MAEQLTLDQLIERLQGIRRDLVTMVDGVEQRCDNPVYVTLGDNFEVYAVDYDAAYGDVPVVVIYAAS